MRINTSWLKNFSKNIFKNKITSNFFYLSLFQVANSILPFVTLPYLVSTIGFDKVGIVFMAQALMSYLTILTDYGFNLTATKFISINKLSSKKLEYIYNAVVSTKIFLIAIAFSILLLLTFVVPLFSEEKVIFILSFTIVVGNTFFPTWFFQGIEEMKYISLMNFISKIFFTASIFLFITQKEDYVKVNFLLGIGNILSTTIALLVISKKYLVKTRLGRKYVKTQLNEGWHIFISNLSVNIYMYSNVFILGLFASKTILGYFSVADRCIQGIRQLLIVFYQVTYPKACSIAEQSHALLLQFYRQVFFKFLLLIVFGCAVLFAFAPFIVYILTKAYQPEVTTLLRYMCLIPVIVALNIPCNQSAVIYQLKKAYTIVVIIGSLINVLSNIFLAKKFNAYGTVSAIYVTEIFITAGLYFILYYKNGGKYSLQQLVWQNKIL